LTSKSAEPGGYAVFQPQKFSKNWAKTPMSYSESFEQITPQSLTADYAGFYKLRVGDYRVIYEFDSEARIIFIDKIGHRSEIYNE
jgi:mRNA-degrading endonuclease RelE of RelBE toxin-antitoxin system